MPNEIKYNDQKWGSGTACDGEQLTVNGTYTGQHLGTPTQDAKDADPNKQNADPYWIEHNTIRYGTIMQDADTNANMPTVVVEDDEADSDT